MLPPKEEHEALFKEYPRPDLDSRVPPKGGQICQFLGGKCLPNEHDTELAKIQSAVLAYICPLTFTRQHLIEGGLEDDPNMIVPRSEVLAL